MARMSLDDKFLRESRVALLAEFCGWGLWATRGCILDIWNLSYDRITPNIPPEDIMVTVTAGVTRGDAPKPVHAGGFMAALIQSGLGRTSTRKDQFYEKQVKDKSTGQQTILRLMWKDPEWKGRIYLRGAAERIGYQLTSSVSGQAGGQKSAETRRNKGKGPLRVPSGPLEGVANPSSIASASSSDLAAAPASFVSSAVAPDERAHIDLPVVASVPSGWSKLAFDVWELCSVTHAKLRAEGIEPNSPSWAPLPHGTDLTNRNRELREQGYEVAAARKIYEHVLAVEVAKARDKNTLRWLQPARMFSDKSFALSRGESPESVSSTAGRDVRTGRSEPHPAEEYGQGDQQL